MNRYDQIMASLKAAPIGHVHGQRSIHLAEGELQELERKLDTTLPGDYREFLRDYGAYDVPTALFPVRPNSDCVEDGGVENFSGVVSEEGRNSFDLLNCHNNMRQDFEDWPLEWLPIAHEGSGNVIGLSIKGKQKGAVNYFVVSRVPDSQHIYPVADSFDQFMSILTLLGE